MSQTRMHQQFTHNVRSAPMQNNNGGYNGNGYRQQSIHHNTQNIQIINNYVAPQFNINNININHGDRNNTNSNSSKKSPNLNPFPWPPNDPTKTINTIKMEYTSNTQQQRPKTNNGQTTYNQYNSSKLTNNSHISNISNISHISHVSNRTKSKLLTGYNPKTATIDDYENALKAQNDGMRKQIYDIQCFLYYNQYKNNNISINKQFKYINNGKGNQILYKQTNVREFNNPQKNKSKFPVLTHNQTSYQNNNSVISEQSKTTVSTNMDDDDEEEDGDIDIVNIEECNDDDLPSTAFPFGDNMDELINDFNENNEHLPINSLFNSHS